MKSTLLVAGLIFATAGWPLAAAADDDNVRARRLNADALALVLAGYEAYRSGDAAGAVEAWLPVAAVAPHQVQYQLADLLANGVGAPADPALAATVAAEAAGHGHVEAQFLLGLLIESRQGPAGDVAAAADWYRLAAATGMPRAQNNLGVLYANGRLEPGGDGLGAEYWLATAARQGFADAQFNLGALYEGGGGVEADGVRALAWLTLAARQGHAGARTLAGALSDRLTPRQLSEAITLLDSGTLVPAGP